MSQSLLISTAERIDSPTIVTFSSLPLEIRTSVWEFGSFLPRNLDIWSQLLGSLENNYNTRDHIVAAPRKFLTTRPVPAILHINRESRSIGLKYYSLEFGWEMKDEESGLEMRVAPRIYYNPYADRICFMGSFIDPLQEQGLENGALPWSLCAPRSDQTSLVPSSVAINLWPFEQAYGFEEYAVHGHVPSEFGFTIGLWTVKEVLLFWESGLEIDEDDSLLGAQSFEFVELATNNMDRERSERLELGRTLLEQEFQARIGYTKRDLRFGRISQAELQERLAHLEIRPVVRLVRLMVEGEFPPAPKCQVQFGIGSR